MATIVVALLCLLCTSCLAQVATSNESFEVHVDDADVAKLAQAIAFYQDQNIEQIQTSDGKVLLDSQVQNLVDAMAAFAPPAAGQTTLAANYATTLAPVIAANWQ